MFSREFRIPVGVIKPHHGDIDITSYDGYEEDQNFHFNRLAKSRINNRYYPALIGINTSYISHVGGHRPTTYTIGFKAIVTLHERIGRLYQNALTLPAYFNIPYAFTGTGKQLMSKGMMNKLCDFLEGETDKIPKPPKICADQDPSSTALCPYHTNLVPLGDRRGYLKATINMDIILYQKTGETGVVITGLQTPYVFYNSVILKETLDNLSTEQATRQLGLFFKEPQIPGFHRHYSQGLADPRTWKGFSMDRFIRYLMPYKTLPLDIVLHHVLPFLFGKDISEDMIKVFKDLNSSPRSTTKSSSSSSSSKSNVRSRAIYDLTIDSDDEDDTIDSDDTDTEVTSSRRSIKRRKV